MSPGEIVYTQFPDKFATSKQEYCVPWAEFVLGIENPAPRGRKEQLPLVKLARFGELRSPQNCLRYDANVIRICGIEIDYDGELVAMAEAGEKLALAGIRSVLHTTPSHTIEKPRWRGFCPLSREHEPGARRAFVARVNGILGGIIAPESFALSQPFFIGRVNGGLYETRRVDGSCVDELEELDSTAIDGTPKQGHARGEKAKQARDADPVIARLRERGMVKRDRQDGGVDITCPFESSHTKPGGESATTYFAAHTGGYAQGHFVCKHSHCAARTDAEFLTAIGLGAPESAAPTPKTDVSLDDFYAYMPMHKFIFKPTGELWPTESINTRLPHQMVAGEKMKPAAWLDRFAPVEQMTWAPCEPQLIENKLIDRGGWIARQGCHVFNLYRPPPILAGDPSKAGLWRDHLARIFPDEAKRIECWLAHHIQKPGTKVNHCLVLRGQQGIGKDTVLEPVKQAIGAWNWQEINPAQMLMRFNEWCRAVIVRVNEARDLGDYDRFAFYDHSKVYMAAPPDVLRVDEKNIREYCIPNVVGVIITTNHEADGICLDADDRRHFVANSEATKEDFDPQYWTDFWNWYADGGLGHVAAYLRDLDLSEFDAKAPPPKTEAFWRIVHSNAAPEDAELAGLIEALSNPQILTLSQLAQRARDRHAFEVAEFLTSLKTRRNVQHRLQVQGYVAVRNQDRKDGLWLVDGKRQAVYAQRKLSYRASVEAIRRTFSGSERQ